jgi:hypothetical protein
VTSSDLVRPEDRAVGGLARAEELWTPEHRAALARYLGVAPDNPALFPMMAVCAAWGLDPFAGQVWLLKQKGRDAEGSERWRPAAGRDGYLAIANRQPDYRGVTGDVVRESDRFRVEWQTEENGMRPLVSHSYEQGPTGEEGKRHVRGNVLGAWAVLFRDGRLPVYYFAPWSEHMRDPSKSAWSHRSAMILKAAQSMALRLGYSITGLVPADELSAGLPGTAEEIVEAPPERPWLADDLPWGDDQIAERLREAVRLSWTSGSMEWSRARLAMLLHGAEGDDETRRGLAKAIEDTLPAEPEPEEVDGGPVNDSNPDNMGNADYGTAP